MLCCAANNKDTMFETALVCFREGIEAFLIVAITAGYLIKTDRRNLLPALWAGIGFAGFVSVGIAFAVRHYKKTALFEGTMAVIAAVLVASLTYYVAKNAKNFKNHLQTKVDHAHSQDGFTKHFLMFIFAAVMVTREAVEVTMLLIVISFKYQQDATPMMFGGIIGAIAAAMLGFLWVKYSHLINLRRFLQVTTVFLMLFTVYLGLYGIHELAEAKVFPVIDNHAWAKTTGHFIKKGFFGAIITYGMMVIPAIFLIQGYLNSRRLKAAAQ